MTNHNDELMEATAKAAVLSARVALDEIEEHLGVPLDLRSFMVGSIAARLAELPIPIPAPFAVGSLMDGFGPELDRLEMEAAAENGGGFDDLPTFDPGNGS